MNNCTGIRCILQAGTVDPATCSCVSSCPQATPPKTWADTIRAMTEEQLAEAFMATEKYGRIHNGGRTLEWWLDFLRQEAAEVTNVPGKSYVLFAEEGRISL